MALSVPVRRDIITLLAERGQQSASDISKQFNVTASAISQHLKILREAELVTMEKRAQQRIYGVNPAAMRGIEAWAKNITERYNRLDVVLNELKAKEQQ